VQYNNGVQEGDAHSAPLRNIKRAARPDADVGGYMINELCA